MHITDLLRPDRVALNRQADTLDDAIRLLCGLLQNAGALADAACFEQDVFAREAQGSICMGGGLAIPHAKSEGVQQAALAALTLDPPLPCPTPDGVPVSLLFLIAAPKGENDLHIQVLSGLAGLLLDKEFCANLRKAQSPQAFCAAIAAKENVPLPADSADMAAHYRLLAVTACPSGLAHTYMAAEALLKAARDRDITLKVETNGAAGIQNELTPREIAEADAIIIAADRAVPTARFVGKRLVSATAGEAVREAETLVDRAVSGHVPVYRGGDALHMRDARELCKEGYRHLMFGVSRFIPFVVAGGVSLALALLVQHLGGPEWFSTMAKTVGDAAFVMIYPVLAAFIAYSIGDMPAFMPGLMGGYLAQLGMTVNNKVSWISSGFWGALIAGFAAGLLVRLLTVWLQKLPKELDNMRAGLLIPFLSLLCIGALMVLVVNPPLGQFNRWLYLGLSNMRGGSRLLLGTVLGALMATDYGGPINKAAYLSGTLALVNGQKDIMAAVMVGGMVPPIGVALACLLFPRKFTPEERRTIPQNLVMGASFVTEGALPFALRDPLRVVPACLLGSGLGGLLAVLLDCSCPAPHGGLFLIAVVGNPGGFLTATLCGALVTALIVGVTKKERKQEQ